MKIRETPFAGLYVIETVCFQDDRGSFQKLFNRDFFIENDLDCNFEEFYYSVNRKDVIRGMHFQTPPYDHTKLVYVSRGRITDAVVDLRKDSITYGRYFKTELDDRMARYLYIPKGFAHGFASLEDGSIVNYAQTSCYSPSNDCGVRYDSCGIEWNITDPVVSDRDLTFDKLDDFKSPF